MIAIITARSGSKRIPGKNIRNFCGKPIIGYSIELALNSGIFSEVMVSTDSDQISDIAIQYGAKVPFLRSRENSSDFAGTAEVIVEVLEEYEKMGKIFKNGCCIYPTAPLLKVSTLVDASHSFISHEYSTLFPVVQYSYPIQRSLKLNDNKVSMNWPENYLKRSQDLEAMYHDAGQFYFFDANYLKKETKLFSDNSGAILISEMESQDIDNEMDWKLAELKFQSQFVG